MTTYSDDEIALSLGLPVGRRLDDDTGHPKGYVGTIGPLRAHTPELGKLLRKHIREIDADDLEQHGKVWVDRTSGDEYRIVTTLVDPTSPGDSQVTAFVVRDNLVCYLRRTDAVEQVKVISAGSFSGRRV